MNIKVLPPFLALCKCGMLDVECTLALASTFDHIHLNNLKFFIDFRFLSNKVSPFIFLVF
jgi:hypothetical protein